MYMHVHLLLQNENASDQQAFKSEIVHKLHKEKK